LEGELKGLFWQYDKQRDTLTKLDELILDAPNLDLTIFVVKFASITEALIKNNEISAKQRIRRFLDGLSMELRDKAFELCIKRDWKLSANDTGTKEPSFNELKQFILGKAQLAQKRSCTTGNARFYRMTQFRRSPHIRTLRNRLPNRE
jgi:hypothetical protein